MGPSTVSLSDVTDQSYCHREKNVEVYPIGQEIHSHPSILVEEEVLVHMRTAAVADTADKILPEDVHTELAHQGEHIRRTVVRTLLVQQGVDHNHLVWRRVLDHNHLVQGLVRKEPVHTAVGRTVAVAHSLGAHSSGFGYTLLGYSRYTGRQEEEVLLRLDQQPFRLWCRTRNQSLLASTWRTLNLSVI